MQYILPFCTMQYAKCWANANAMQYASSPPFGTNKSKKFELYTESKQTIEI